MQALDAVPGLARARQLVRLAGKAHLYSRNSSIFEGAEHLVSSGVGRSAQVGVAQDEHERRFDIIDVGNWRAIAVIVRIVKRRLAEPVLVEQGEVSRVPPGRPTGDVALGDGSGKAIGVSYHPVGQQ